MLPPPICSERNGDGGCLSRVSGGLSVCCAISGLGSNGFEVGYVRATPSKRIGWCCQRDGRNTHWMNRKYTGIAGNELRFNLHLKVGDVSGVFSGVFSFYIMRLFNTISLNFLLNRDY